MPPLPPVPNTLEFILRYSDGADSNIMNRFFMTYTGVVSPTDAATLAATVNSQWITHMAGSHVNTVHLLSVTINDLSSKTGAQVINVTGGAGTASPPALSSAACAVLSAKTSLKYRGGHARVYLPGIAEGNLATPNTWSTAFQTALQAAWVAFLNAIIQNVPSAIGVLAEVVAHRYGRTATAPVAGQVVPFKTPSVPLDAPFTQPITSWGVNPRVASQRRRNQQST